MVPAHEKFYGSLPRNGLAPPPFVSLEPSPSPSLKMPLTTLKNPGHGDMYRNEAQESPDKMIPYVKSMKGFGLAK